jgi:hypothetical protein
MLGVSILLDGVVHMNRRGFAGEYTEKAPNY